MCSEGQGGAGGLAAREVSTPPPAVLQTGAQVTLPSPSPTRDELGQSHLTDGETAGGGASPRPTLGFHSACPMRDGGLARDALRLCLWDPPTRPLLGRL